MSAEVASSMPVEEPAASTKPSGDLQSEFSPELLRLYYDRIFPAQLMCRWLGYGTHNETVTADNLLHRREFSFTTGDDVYIRYLSYENAEEFRKDLCKKLPYKIDIGAVFSAPARDHKKFKLFEPLQREFLIDIDLTDYEFLDCDVKKIETCDRCWPIMALAARVLNRILTEDFGFEHLLFVYSGRRGLHCWGCDTRARVMSNEVRSGVADYLTPKLNAATGRLSISQPMHPSLRRAFVEDLEPFFKETLLKSAPEGFGVLDDESGQARLLGMLGDENVKDHFVGEWGRARGAAMSGAEKWAALVKHVHKPTTRALSLVRDESLGPVTVPRLDVNVSKGMNHLLKSPWCVHPKTGRVCVPVDAERADAFDPSQVPTLRMVAEDLDRYHKEGAATGADEAFVKDISRTRLGTYEAAFDAFLRKLEASIRAERVRAMAAAKANSFDF